MRYYGCNTIKAYEHPHVKADHRFDRDVIQKCFNFVAEILLTTETIYDIMCDSCRKTRIRQQ